MRKLASYLTSFLLTLLIITSVAGSVLARDPGASGNPDDSDANAFQQYCEQKYPSNNDNFTRCFSMLQLVVSQGWSSVGDTAINCSELPSAWIDTCQVAAPDGTIRNDIMSAIQPDLATFIQKLAPYYSSDGGAGGGDPASLTPDDVKIPFLDSDGARAAQARLDGNPTIKQNILNACRNNADNQGTSLSNVTECMSCASIAYGFGLENVEQATCQSRISSPVDTANGQISLGGTGNGNYCLNTCGRYNDRVGGIGSSQELAETINDRSIGAQTKFQIPGVNCGAANTPYDSCCLPTTTQISCTLQDLKVVNYPQAKSWFNPLNWTANVVKSGATLAQDSTISTLCAIFKNQLGRRIDKIDTAVFRNDNIPEIQGTVKETGYCMPDPANPNVRAEGVGASCRCISDGNGVDSNNFGQNLCNRIAPNDTDTCLSCANIAVMSGMNCSSDNLSDDQKQTCNSCTSQPFYAGNVTTFQAMANLGDQGRNFCQGVPAGEFDRCVQCMIPSVFGISGIWTSFGCLQTDPGAFISQTVIPIGISLGAAAAFLTILYSAYLIQTSQGNAEKLKKARAYLNASLIGLMLIIFAALILQIVGIQILRIPGLT